MRVKDAVGRFGEELAVARLSETGMRILDRNWRCPEGELDIVGRDGDCLVFVEVKTRSTTAFGEPAEAVNPAKAARLRRLAVCWLAAHRELVAGRPPIRFDVVAIVRLAPGGPSVAHLKGAL